MYTFAKKGGKHMKDKELIDQIEKNIEEMKICNEKLKEFKKVMDVVERSEKVNG